MKPKPDFTREIPARSEDPRLRISLRVNDREVSREVSTRMLLTDFIRHELGLTGTHVGCEHGVCGACTVLIDGCAARACLTFAIQADGTKIRTIESEAASDGTLSPLQQAFTEAHGLQCGYCTPGMIMNIRAHLDGEEEFDLSDDGIRDIISGNLCRCTGYANIIEAVRIAARAEGRK